MQNSKKNIKKKLILVALFALILSGSFYLGKLSATGATVDEVEQIEMPTVEETPEEKVEEKVEAKKSIKAARNNINVTEVKNSSDTNVRAVKEEATEEVKLSVETLVKNPTIVVGEKELNTSLYGVSVKKNGNDITSTCDITLDNSKVNMTVSGEYSVTIKANCGENGSASRVASVTIYVPKVNEAPKAADKNDTSIAVEAPKVETTRDAVEMTKVTVLMNDGSTVTFVKDEVENIYAAQKERVLSESSLPSNYVISGNTLTVNGKTFTAR